MAGHEIVMVNNADAEGIKRISTALKYFLEKGGNINIADGDGMTVKRIGDAAAVLVPALKPFLTVSNKDMAVGPTLSVPVELKKTLDRNDLCACNSMKKYKACCGKN